MGKMDTVEFIKGCVFILMSIFFGIVATALAVATESLKDQRETDPEIGNLEVGVGYAMTLISIVIVLLMLDQGIQQFR